MVIEDGIVYDESLQDLDVYGHEQAMLAERQQAELQRQQLLEQNEQSQGGSGDSATVLLPQSSNHSLTLGHAIDGMGSSLSLLLNESGGSFRYPGDDNLDDRASLISTDDSNDETENDEDSEEDEEKKIRRQILWAIGGMVRCCKC